MPVKGISLEAQSPGTPHADLGYWLQSQVIGQSMAMVETHLQAVVEQITANRFVLPRNRATAARITDKGTAIVEVHGMLINRAPVLGSFWGLTAYEGLAEQFRRLMTNDDVKRVVLDINSPGGLVSGIRSCSEALEKLAAKKPVHAIAHDMACSAAYWLGCVAEELSVTSDGMAGSIGVRGARVSYAESLERDGVQVRIYRAGATKADGIGSLMLGDGEAAESQYECDRDYDRFVAHVAKHRPLSEDDVRDTDARTWVGSDAVSAGLADRVESLEDMVERLEKSAAKVKPKKKLTSQSGSKAGIAPAERIPANPLAPDEEASSGRKQGARLMTTSNAAETSASLAQQITDALAALGAKAASEAPSAQQSNQQAQPAAAAPAQGQPAQSGNSAADQAAAAVARVFSILECEEAKSRPQLALALAKTGIEAAAAKAILAAAAVEKAADGQQAELTNALAQQMAKPGNAAGVKPEASADGSRPSLAETFKTNPRFAKPNTKRS